MIAQAAAPVTCTRCVRCRRQLTNPKAIDVGMGAVCARKNTLALAAWVARVEEVAAPAEAPSLVALAQAIALPARPVLAIAPATHTPEWKAIKAAMAAARAEEIGAHTQTSKVVPGLHLTRRGRQVSIQYGPFFFDYAIFGGQALLFSAPPHFTLPVRAQVVVDTALTAYAARFDRAVAA
jgi:hypothetical protein